jgi:spermidine synthase
MIPWELLDRVPVPNSRSELSLRKRDDEYSIRIDNLELMNSRMHGSEEALAELAHERLRNREGSRILVGGLGMGFTLAAVLRKLDSKGEAIVAELVPDVIRWNRGPLAPLHDNALADPRVTVYEGDVADLMREPEQPFNAILMDVDNGPDGLTRKGNDWLYTKAGLLAAREALHPGGILAIWSIGTDRAFTKRLKSAGYRVEEVRVHSRGDRGGRRTIWLATRRR